jgi:hypothetical protein
MPCDTIVVEEQFDPGNVTIDGCEMIGAKSGSLTVSPGASVGVDISVRNENPDAAEVTVELAVGGGVETVTGQIPAGSVGTIEYNITFQQEGVFTPEPTITLANRVA